MFYIIPGIFNTSLFPIFISKFKEGEKSVMSFLKKSFRFLAGISYISILFICIFADIIIHIIDDSFDTSANLLRILSFTSILVALGGLQNSYLNIKNSNKTVLILTFFGACFNISLNFIVIPLLGVYGSAIATVVSYLLVVIIIPTYIKKCQLSNKFIWNSLIHPSLKFKY